MGYLPWNIALIRPFAGMDIAHHKTPYRFLKNMEDNPSIYQQEAGFTIEDYLMWVIYNIKKGIYVQPCSDKNMISFIPLGSYYHEPISQAILGNMDEYNGTGTLMLTQWCPRKHESSLPKGKLCYPLCVPIK